VNSTPGQLAIARGPAAHAQAGDVSAHLMVVVALLAVFLARGVGTR
jgi:hypothetical protein